MTSKRLWVFLALLATAVAGVFLGLDALPQNPAYHDFADTRTIYAVENFWDVISNLPYLFVGLFGLFQTMRYRNDRNKFIDRRETWAAYVAFTGIFLVCFGSSYYHLIPENGRLVWDRIPMTIGFMGVFSMMISERVDVKWGVRLLPALVILGAGSVLYWNWTEAAGAGDLRLYGVVQYLPLFVIPLMIWVYPPRYTGIYNLFIVLAFYGAAKLFEAYDQEIFRYSAEMVSGHTMKHFASGFGTAFLVRYISVRKPAV